MIRLDELEAFRETLPEYKRQETFSFFGHIWDIVLGLFLIRQTPRPIILIDSRQAYEAIGAYDSKMDSGEPKLFRLGTPINVEHAMSDKCDTTNPLLAATCSSIASAKLLFIDGMHRIYKAYHTGVAQVPCNVLSEDESRICRE